MDEAMVDEVAVKRDPAVDVHWCVHLSVHLAPLAVPLAAANRGVGMGVSAPLCAGALERNAPPPLPSPPPW